MVRYDDAQAARCLHIAFNQAGRRGRRRWLARALAIVDGAGARATVAETRGPGDATDFAAAAPAGTDVIVVVGGDVLANEAVNGLLSRAGAAPAVAVLLFGTANVLAAEMVFAPCDRDGASRSPATGTTRRIALGRANGRGFTMMAGIGFDAEIVAAVRPSLKRVIGNGAFVLPGSWCSPAGRHSATPSRATPDVTRRAGSSSPTVAFGPAATSAPRRPTLRRRRCNWCCSSSATSLRCSTPCSPSPPAASPAMTMLASSP
ncbi:MAG: hypothetical protein EXQ97_05365 [Alphaproteobacteria bacterium]|nr:hypothetical protein [Alphaproteobacteria bacterium]